MKIAIIVFGNLENAPYVKYYTEIFDSLKNIEYVYITWNRKKVKTETLNKNLYEFDKISPLNNSKFKKCIHFKLYSNYVKQILNNEKFDFILVFTLQAALFMSNYLLKNYKNKYLFDIRDYSPVYILFKKRLEKIIKYSAATTISSLGFKDWLPNGYNYILGHNAEKNLIDESIKNDFKNIFLKNVNPVKILTIGQIRDLSSNSRLVLSFKNNSKFNLYFEGDGQANDSLKKISKECNNVYFNGRYLKKEEASIVEKYDLINILLPVSVADNTLMTNRFYLSLIHRKPMIVNYESFQAKYVSKYNVGVIIRNNDNIPVKLTEYINNFDEKKYNLGCSELLKEIKSEINKFEFNIISTLK